MELYEDYQGITIFEIPIYALSKDEHCKRWDKKIKRDTQRFIEKGFKEETAISFVMRQWEHNMQWKYNQLVGMFSLSVDIACKDALVCSLFCNSKAPKNICCSSYLPFRNQYLFRELIYLKHISTDTELITAIKSKIDFLKIQYNIESYYFDFTALENMISLDKILSLTNQNLI